MGVSLYKVGEFDEEMPVHVLLYEKFISLRIIINKLWSEQ